MLQGISAEEALAQELQEAIAEAQTHQSMAAQHRQPAQVLLCISLQSGMGSQM